MKNVDIAVFNIARTVVDRDAVRHWLDYLEFTEYEIPGEDTISDPALLIALAAKRCYLAFEVGVNPNLQRVRKDLVEYLDNVLASGHGSVFEHAVYTFAVEGVSRVFTGEMNRHRAGVAISEGSMRFIRYKDIPWWMPPMMRLSPEEEQLLAEVQAASIFAMDWQEKLGWPEDKMAKLWLANKKSRTQAAFEHHYTSTETTYAELQDIWREELAPKSKFHGKKQVTSMIRRIIPMGVATGAVYTLNMRALRHVLALRATPEAEEEICHVASKMLHYMVGQEPAIFGDFAQDAEGFWVPKYKKV